MRRLFLCPAVVSLMFFFAPSTSRADEVKPAAGDLQWIDFPDKSKFQVRGLHWFEENAPQLWRLPASRLDALPKGVQNRARCPSGARIAFRSTTTRLAIRVESTGGGAVKSVEAYVDGRRSKSLTLAHVGKSSELLLFNNEKPIGKEIVVYLPHGQEILVHALGVDRDARVVEPGSGTSERLPIVYYGSSVCQGSGAASSSQTYEAVLGRDLQVDFINLGFGGAGKAEPDVVELVNSIPACCYVFDLGKSYGDQDASAFLAMLQTVRRSHPKTPMVVITPITSLRETKDADYAKRSVHTRSVMQEATNQQILSGDSRITLVKGEDLLGFDDHALLSKDGVHPSDEGYEKIAASLRPILQGILEKTTGQRAR